MRCVLTNECDLRAELRDVRAEAVGRTTGTAPAKRGRKFLPPAMLRRPLAVSLTPAERERIEAAAENALEPVAVYIRNAALARVEGGR